jgi:hypothetical protein
MIPLGFGQIPGGNQHTTNQCRTPLQFSGMPDTACSQGFFGLFLVAISKMLSIVLIMAWQFSHWR